MNYNFITFISIYFISIYPLNQYYNYNQSIPYSYFCYYNECYFVYFILYFYLFYYYYGNYGYGCELNKFIMVLQVIFNYFNNSFHVNMFIFYYNFRIYWNDMLLNIYNIFVQFFKVKILENVSMLESILF
jgi:hypothetical protein